MVYEGVSSVFDKHGRGQCGGCQCGGMRLSNPNKCNNINLMYNIYMQKCKRESCIIYKLTLHTLVIIVRLEWVVRPITKRRS